MTTYRSFGNGPSYRVWLRRGSSSSPQPLGTWHRVRLTEIGHAAARETFISATPHMAGIWTDLFESMIAPGCQLRWAGRGPGVGRDARIAYSSLIGRYMARAYLTQHERVRLLVPLDVAKRALKGSCYSIKNATAGRGLLADWIGMDDQGLVVVEAKGTYDPLRSPWEAPSLPPAILQTAIRQANRTAVFESRGGHSRQLPARRWAVASRWGVESKPNLTPTILAWDPEEHGLNSRDYQRLYGLLVGADADCVLTGLGYPAASRDKRVVTPRPHRRLDRGLSIGDVQVPPGFPSVLGPFGTHPLWDEDDLLRIRQILTSETRIAIASLSERYLRHLSAVEEGDIGLLEDFESEQIELEDGTANGVSATQDDATVPHATRDGLTVAWLRGGKEAAEVEWT